MHTTGDAWLDDNYGVKLDGEGDSICLGERSAEGWSDDGDFTIAFSFTKAHCYVPGQYEFLFSTFGECQTSSWSSTPRCSVTGGRNSGVHIFLGCDNDESNPSSTIDTSDRGHLILRIMVTDDAGKRAQYDVDLNLNQGVSGASSSSWVHLSLAVTKESVRTYIDGQPVDNANVGYAQGQSYWDFATHRENIALGDPENLRGQLGPIHLKGCAYLGGGAPDQWTASQGYAGSFAGVQLIKGAVQPADAACLYTVSSQHSGQCPNFASLFSGGQGSPWRNGAAADGNVGQDLAYMQTPHQMITDELMSGAANRAMDGAFCVFKSIFRLC